MFVIYADEELERKQQGKKPVDYRVNNPIAKELFQEGCEVAKEESKRFQKISHKTQHLPREFRGRELS